MKRVRALDWVEKGFQLLSNEGSPALTLDRLCTELGKTKGSFYHHFKDMDNYIQALLSTWSERNTQVPIDVANQVQDPQKKLEELDKAVQQLDHRLDQIIRKWADHDPRAQRAVKMVDQARVGYLTTCLKELGLGQELAQTMAEMEYISLLGTQAWYEKLTTPEARKMAKNFRKAFQLFTEYMASRGTTG